MQFDDIDMQGPLSVQVVATLPAAPGRTSELAYQTLDSGLYYGLANGTWQLLASSAPGVNALLQNGSRPLTANWDAGSYKITAQQLESDVATGTSPLVVASTTLVSNLNAQYLNGLASSKFIRNDNITNNVIGSVDTFLPGLKLGILGTFTDAESNSTVFQVRTVMNEEPGQTTPYVSVDFDGNGKINFTRSGITAATGTLWMDFEGYLSLESLNVLKIQPQNYATSIGGGALYIDTATKRVAVGATSGLTTDFEVRNAGTTARNSVRLVSPSSTDPSSGGSHVFIGTAVPTSSTNAATYSLLKIGAGASYASEILNLTGAGRLGVGTWTPTEFVELRNDATVDQLKVSGTGTAAGITLSALTNGKSWALYSTGNGHALGAGKFSIYDRSTSQHRLTIDANGRVGISQSTPDSSSMLDINGQVKIRGGSPGANKILQSDAGGLGSWVTLASLGIPAGTGADTQIAFWTGTATQSGSANFFWNNSTNTLWITGSQRTSGKGTFGGTTVGGSEPLEVQGGLAGVSLWDRVTGATNRWVLYANSGLNLWNGSTRFSVDNSGNAKSSNHMEVTKSLQVGTSTQAFGSDAGGIVAIGSGSTSLSSISGAGTRLLWYPKKAAFRAGQVAGAQWDDANIGTNSFAGGLSTTASGAASVALGSSTTASGAQSSVLGGSSNTASNTSASVLGGSSNTASGVSSAVTGGSSNTASGSASIVLGGSNNQATGLTAVALGTGARATHNYSFVYSNDSVNLIQSSRAGQFVIKATGGVWIGDSGTSAPMVSDDLIDTSTGAYLSGSGVWTDNSDENSKENFEDLSLRDILHKVLSLPVRKWNYKTDGAGIKHIGPTAQDFFRAFGIGNSETSLASLDSAGVALAAIQGLYKLVREIDLRLCSLGA